MAKILLVKLKEPHKPTQKACYMPPIGLWSIRANVGADICDEHMGDRIEDFINKTKYDIIGISCQFSIQHYEYLKVSKIARSTGAKVIAGGFHAGMTKKPKYVDEIIKGDGERYFGVTDLLYPLFSMREIRRYWKKDSPHNLQSKTKKWINIETSRGCNNGCKYCGVPDFWNRWRGFPIKYLNKYFKYLKEKGIEELFIEDDNVSYDKYRFIELLKLLRKHGLYWSVPNGMIVRDVMPRKFAQANCWRVSLPFETGSERTAKLMGMYNKWVDFDYAKRLVELCGFYGIKTCGFFIIGYPGETKEDIRKTLAYANHLPLDERNIYVATPYPGTPLYETCKTNGYLVKGNLYKNLLYSKCVINTPEFSHREISEIRKTDRHLHMLLTGG